MSRVNLSIVKGLIEALETELALAETKHDEASDQIGTITTYAKAAGLAYGVVQEATLIMGDIVKLTQQVSSQSLEKVNRSDLLALFSGALPKTTKIEGKN